MLGSKGVLTEVLERGSSPIDLMNSYVCRRRSSVRKFRSSSRATCMPRYWSTGTRGVASKDTLISFSSSSTWVVAESVYRISRSSVFMTRMISSSCGSSVIPRRVSRFTGVPLACWRQTKTQRSEPASLNCGACVFSQSRHVCDQRHALW